MEPQSYTFYPKTLRDRAVAEAIKPGAIRRDVAKRLNVGDQTIARWLREDYGTAIPGPKELANPVRKTAIAIPEQASPSPAAPIDSTDDTNSLRSQLAASQAERDLLKGLLSHYLAKGKS